MSEYANKFSDSDDFKLKILGVPWISSKKFTYHQLKTRKTLILEKHPIQTLADFVTQRICSLHLKLIQFFLLVIQLQGVSFLSFSMSSKK